MATRSYVGTPDPNDTEMLNLRYVHFDGSPDWMLPTLRTMWERTFNRDTVALIEALLAHMWSTLDADVPDGTGEPLLVAGVGQIMDVGGVDDRVRTSREQVLEALVQYVYIIDATDDSITVLNLNPEIMTDVPAVERHSLA